MKSIYLSWIGYQRRNESLAPLLNAKLQYFPNKFNKRWLRPLDYLIKFFKTCNLIIKEKPEILYLQFPATFIAIPAWLLHIPYVIDAHNSTWQSFWGKLPMTRFLMRKATAVIVHNPEILLIAQQKDSFCRYVIIGDPLTKISHHVSRNEDQIMLICSFSDDEPIDLFLELIQNMPHKKFIITGSETRIPINIYNNLKKMNNVELTGFLSEKNYEKVLCSSAGAVVLTTREACQPCGACEAASSNTPLIISKNTLSELLFSSVSIQTEHNIKTLSSSINNINKTTFNYDAFKTKWEKEVKKGIKELQQIINKKTQTNQK